MVAADEVLTGDRVITQGRVRVWVAVVGQLRAALPPSTLSPLATTSHNSPHATHSGIYSSLFNQQVKQKKNRRIF